MGLVETPERDRAHVRDRRRRELHGAAAASLRKPALVSSKKS